MKKRRNKKSQKSNKTMRINISTDKYKGINLTSKFFRFLKYHNSYLSFRKAIMTKDEGRALYNTFVALKTDTEGKKEQYANDPIKWIYMHNSTSEKDDFLRGLLNIHIDFDETKEGFYYWLGLHHHWLKYLAADFNNNAIAMGEDVFHTLNSLNEQIVPFVSMSYYKSLYVLRLLALLWGASLLSSLFHTLMLSWTQ